MKKQTEPVPFLLVDDLPENLLALEALLRRDDVVLLKARSGREALELLLEHDVALALIDVQMPEMNGFELAELMRGIERTRSVPIIFVTAGSADTQRTFRGYEAGAVDFIRKPIEADILKSKANVFFDMYRQRQEVARLLAESRRYAEALEEADRRKDEFLATLAHELRNPLAPLRNGLELLQTKPDDDTAGDLRRMMGRQLSHMVRLIDDLLDTSRLSQGKIELRKKKLAVQSVINAALETCQQTFGASGHVLVRSLPDKDVWVDADPVRLEQIICNLVSNAHKYTPPGGGRITVSAQERAGVAEIVVSDTGIGIPKEELDAIFELFTQIGRSSGSGQGGLGIGLALVRQLVELHGGTIKAESAGPGKGSTFRVTLPAVDAPLGAAPKAEQQKPAPHRDSRNLRVLVVDDNVAAADTIGMMVELIGHDVSVVYGGEAGLEAARDKRPDVVLLDIGLPGIDGNEVARELRKDNAFRDTVLVAQTGWGQERDRQRSKEAGFDHHFVKPVRLEKLSELLGTIAQTPKAESAQSALS